MSGAKDFIIRTEDLLPEDVLDLFVATERDAELVSALKLPTPLIIEGSRGTGKSFLLRVCEQQQLQEFESSRVLPVYLSFAKSSLLNTSDPMQFLHWMLARLSSRILRTIQQQGFGLKPAAAVSKLIGAGGGSGDAKTPLEEISQRFEETYKNATEVIDTRAIPTVEDLKDAVEDICRELRIRRLNILFDEAAHIFRPEQQRQFFTLFRDLRSPYLTCNAAVYPGVTSYGGSFEIAHDARIEALNRDVTSPLYLDQMREIVIKQSDSDLQREIERYGENFDALAFAVSGNPRLLLKTISISRSLRTSDVETSIKEFYRNAIWSEHDLLSNRYPGHKDLIDWGRNFIERVVIPDTVKKNESREEGGRDERTCFIWVHRDAPEASKEALRLLCYTGVLTKIDDWAVATRREVGTRFAVNIGCLAATVAKPTQFISGLRKGITIRRFTEYGANHSEFVAIRNRVGTKVESDVSVGLSELLLKPISVLDLSTHQKSALSEIGIQKISDAFQAQEITFMRARYIGPVRSRRIKNIVDSAVLEYLSG